MTEQPVFEVELKFPLSRPEEVLARLISQKLVASKKERQSDQYFNHPVRDFAVTDEAVRIRTLGEINLITYKGPVLDKQTKTRREIETRLGDGEAVARQFGETLIALGFRKVRQVVKWRTSYPLQFAGREFELAWDEVDQLGVFLEIETLAPASEKEQARDALLKLAAEFGLEHSERRSYLQLLLEKFPEPES